MGQTIRFGVSLNSELLEKFDALCDEKSYQTRSEAIRDLIRGVLVQKEWEQSDQEVAGVLTLVYDHHTSDLAQRLIEIQHEQHDIILSSMVLLGPNHTGRGRPLAVWDAGGWNMPGGIVPVDAALAAALLTAETRLAADVVAHLGEHALEVQLPFLQARNPGCRIVPVVVSEPDPYVLQEVAESMAGVIRAWEKPVSIIVSSDMSHYVSQETARRLDALALARILALDPEGLYRVVHEMEISMCGVLPMVLGLFLARALGAHDAVLTAYATSGEVSGDYEHVVGYAGVLVQ